MKGSVLVYGLFSLDYTLVKNIDRIGFVWCAKLKDFRQKR